MARLVPDTKRAKYAGYLGDELHIGYVTEGLYRTFYEDTVKNIVAWPDTRAA